METALREEDGRGRLIVSNYIAKTSLESFRALFLHDETMAGGRRNRGVGKGSSFDRLFNDLCLSRAARVLVPFNVRRINYHKNARFMRINIVFGRASKRLTDYPPRIREIYLRILLRFSTDFLLREFNSRINSIRRREDTFFV